ncbi:hypothetical protein Q7P37_006502 [Cladosporium fusiforme]
MQDTPEVIEIPGTSSNDDGSPQRVKRRAGRPVILSSESDTDNLGPQTENTNITSESASRPAVHDSDSDDIVRRPAARTSRRGKRASRPVVHESDSEADAEDVAPPHGSDDRPPPQRKGRGPRRVVDDSESEADAEDVAQPRDRSQHSAERSPHVGDGDSAGIDIICCPCGNDSDQGDMVQCDSCSTYQHLECVGITLEQAAEMQYYCPECDPNAFDEFGIHQASLPTEAAPKHRLRKGLKRHSGSEGRDSSQPEPESESEPEPAKQRRRRAKANRSKRTETLRSETAIDAVEAAEALPPGLQPLDEVTAASHRVTKNIHRWNQAIGSDGTGIKLLRVVLPTKIKGRVDYMRDLLRAPVVDDRQLFVEDCISSRKSNKGTQSWQFMVKNKNTPDIPAFKVTGSFYNKTTLRDKAAALEVGDKLCRYLERLPAPLETAKAGPTKPTAMSALLQVIVFSDLFDGTDWVSGIIQDLHGLPDGFHSPVVQTSNGLERSTGDLSIITNKGKDGAFHEHNLNVSVAIKKLDMGVNIPDIDDGLIAFWPKVFDKAYLTARKVPDEKHDKYIHAAKIVRYVQLKLYGAIGIWQDIQKLKDHYIRPFLLEEHRANSEGLDTHKLSGPYGNNRLVLFATRVAIKEFTLVPSRHLSNDVQGQLPNIIIRSGSKTRIAFVLETIMAHYYATGNILQSWRSACECADRVSASLISSEEIKLQYCQCSEKERSTTVHICQLCLGTEVCRDLSRNDSECLTCKKCTANTSMSDDFIAAPGEALRWKILQLLGHDKTIEAEDRHQIRENIWNHLQTFATSVGCYSDTWVDATRTEYTISGRRGRRSPLSLSLDAIHLVSILDDKVVYHADPQNICITADYINRMKRHFTPAVIGLLRLLVERRRQTGIQEGAVDELLDQMDHRYVVHCAYTFSSKFDRVSQSVSSAKKQIALMKRPRVPQSEANSFFRETNLTHGLGQSAMSWTVDEVEAVDNMIALFEAFHGKQIHRSPDGAPWLWIEHHMPPQWSWYRLWRLFAGRLYRFQMLCNRKHETVDSVTTLFLEGVYQHLKHSGRDELFGLPMTIYSKHPLCMSIGHRHHGEQMRTGFKTLHPTALSDYDEGLSNICFEAQVTNHAKFDYPEDDYEMIHNDLLKARLETAHYSVPNDCPRFDFAEIYKDKDMDSTVDQSDPDGYSSDETDNGWSSDDELGDQSLQ